MSTDHSIIHAVKCRLNLKGFRKFNWVRVKITHKIEKSWMKNVAGNDKSPLQCIIEPSQQCFTFSPQQKCQFRFNQKMPTNQFIKQIQFKISKMQQKRFGFQFYLNWIKIYYNFIINFLPFVGRGNRKMKKCDIDTVKFNLWKKNQFNIRFMG